MTNPTTELPKIICISLIEEKDRRTFMRSQFNAIGANFRFLDAIRPNLSHGFPAMYDRKARLSYSLVDLRNGEIGCYISHRQAWIEFLATSDEICCIFEDDVAIGDGFNETVLSLCEKRTDWDIVRLCGTFKRPHRQLRQLHDAHYLVDYTKRQPSGLVGYLLNRAAAKKLLEHTARMIHPIDDSVDREWEHRLRLRGVESPVLCLSDLFASGIGERGARNTNIKNKISRELFRVPSNIRKQFWNFKKFLRYLFSMP